MTVVEACVTSVEEAVDSSGAGANRLELCRALDTGGLTPSADLVHAVRVATDLPLFAMVRPRAGSFQAAPAEVACEVHARAAAIPGVVEALRHVESSAAED